MQQEMSGMDSDIAQRVLYVVGVDKRQTLSLRKRLRRGEVMAFMARLPFT